MNSYNTKRGNQSWMYIVQMKRERPYSISGVLEAPLVCLALSKMMCSPGPDILLPGVEGSCLDKDDFGMPSVWKGGPARFVRLS
jgi:hypothetical protein